MTALSSTPCRLPPPIIEFPSFIAAICAWNSGIFPAIVSQINEIPETPIPAAKLSPESFKFSFVLTSSPSFFTKSSYTRKNTISSIRDMRISARYINSINCIIGTFKTPKKRSNTHLFKALDRK